MVQTTLHKMLLFSHPVISNFLPSLWPGCSVHGILQQEYWRGLPFPSPLYTIVQCSFAVMSNSLHTPGLPVYQKLPKFTQTHVHCIGDAIQPSHPLSLSSPPTLNLSQQQDLFQWVSSLNQVAKVLEFQLQHQSLQWIFRMISFRMYWLDLLAGQGTFKNLLQHHSSKASIPQQSAFFIAQVSYPYMTNVKTIAFFFHLFLLVGG